MPELILKGGFARAIFLCLQTYRCSRVLEIGSFDGDGSTQVLISAIKGLPGRHLDCLEFIPQRYANLVKNTREHDWVRPFQLTSISYDSLSKTDFERDVRPFYAGQPTSQIETIQSWWRSDVEQMKTYKNGFLNSNPLQYDAVLIDGGEFTGFDEFRILREHANCFMLDDTICFKCSEVRRELISDPAWEMIFDDIKERNGSSIFVRKAIIPTGRTRLFRNLMASVRFVVLSLRQQLLSG